MQKLYSAQNNQKPGEGEGEGRAAATAAAGRPARTARVTRPAHAAEPQHQSMREAFGVIIEGFKVPRMWLLGATFGFLMFTSLCVLSWVPTYVQDVETAKLMAAGASAAVAGAQAGEMSGSFAAIGFASSIPMSFITAYLLGRFTSIRARKIMLVVASALGFLYAFAFIIPFEWLPWWLVLLGIESGWTSGVVWSLVPLTMKRAQTMSVGFACVIFFQGLSNLLATPVVGYVIGAADVWSHVAPLCALSACVGVVCCVAYALTGRPAANKAQKPHLPHAHFAA